VSSVQTEQVLVVPTALFHRLGHFQGFSAEVEKYLEALLSGEHVSYRPRGEMEQDPSFKQLIPYVLFCYRDDAGIEHVFRYTRGAGQGEGRLHRKRSVGVGGHISSDDAGSELNPYDEGLRREVEEEVAIGADYQPSLVGLINDDETEVGRVHLGIVHRFDLAEPRVEPREDDIAEAGFQPVGEILGELEHYETWSQICLQALFGRE